MFARFDENPAMTLRVIKETKRYGRTDGQRENSIPPTNKVCGGYKNCGGIRLSKMLLRQMRISITSQVIKGPLKAVSSVVEDNAIGTLLLGCNMKR